MREIVVKIPEDIAKEIENLEKIDVSSVVNRFLIEKISELAKMRKMLEKSELTEEKAKELAEEAMKLVVDANVVFSALIKKGIAFSVFLPNSLSNKFEFIAPEYLWIEIDSKKEKMLKYSGLSREELDELISFLKREIEVIPSYEFLEFIPRAENFLKGHEKRYAILSFGIGFRLCNIFRR